MSSPTSSVDICSLSMDLISQFEPTSIDTPETNVEVVCARWYDATREMVLRKHPWNFAIKRKKIPASSYVPEFGFTKFYPVPSDFLRLNYIGEDGPVLQNTINSVTYRIEADPDGKTSIVTSYDGALPISYIYNCTIVQYFDPIFKIVLATEIARNVVFKFTQSNTSWERLTAHLAEIAPEGYSIDGQERPPIRIERSDNLRARRRGRSKTSGASPYYEFS